MSTSPKQIVADFYNSDFFNNSENVEKYLHPDMELFWNARTGYLHQNKAEVLATTQEAGKSFDSVRSHITHLLEDGNSVTIRLTIFVSTIEAPDDEFPIAHFFAIWEVKDGKLFKGYQMSLPTEDDEKALVSWM
tara:strand:+ start:78951 stop:79352 length:402 start_codon:yes stop_codon:yes gene_type:complete